MVPVGFTYEPETRLARVITGGGSVKARLAARPGAVAALCQVDGRRWLTLQGPIHVEDDPAAVADTLLAIDAAALRRLRAAVAAIPRGRLEMDDAECHLLTRAICGAAPVPAEQPT